MECNSVWRFGRIHVWMSGIDGPVNSKRLQEILQQNATASVCDLNRRWVMQHDYDPKHWSKSKLQRKKKKDILKEDTFYTIISLQNITKN